MKLKLVAILAIFLSASVFVTAQDVQLEKEKVISLTSAWEGERTPDGRPKISDDLLERLKSISIEEAWGYMRNKGYHNQFEAGWKVINPDNVLVGRVLTTQYMPTRPDFAEKIKARGKSEGRIGASNSWPIDMLENGDVYVADGFGKVIDGTLIGDNLGNAIYAKSQTGVVFDGGIRDLEGLQKIDGFVGFVRGMDPSFIKDMMMTCINCPIRIGRATVLPGDLVLGKEEGVIFIPAHFAADLIQNAEFVALKDSFGHMRLKEGKYTPGEIDRKWTEDIKADFLEWVKVNPEKLQMSTQEFDTMMKERNW